MQCFIGVPSSHSFFNMNYCTHQAQHSYANLKNNETCISRQVIASFLFHVGFGFVFSLLSEIAKAVSDHHVCPTWRSLNKVL